MIRCQLAVLLPALVACGAVKQTERPPDLTDATDATATQAGGAEHATCRMHEDCKPGTHCVAMSRNRCSEFPDKCRDGRVPAQPICRHDADCAQSGEGMVCRRYPLTVDYGATGHDSAPLAVCEPACDPAAGTHAIPHTRCRDDGHLESLSCDTDGYECPAPLRCDPGVHADEHGCAKVRCASDHGCDATQACVFGHCSLTAGACHPADTRP